MPASRFPWLSLLLAACLLAGCGPAGRLQPGQRLDLASFSQNQVAVQIFLEVDASGGTWLAATFTPLEADAHLYALDLPRRGVDGVGRPTLLELPPDSPIRALGPLTASVAPPCSSCRSIHRPGPSAR